MPNPVPLLIAAGVAAVALGGKKKRTKSREGVHCDVSVPVPEGYVCDDGLLRVEAVDEGDLEKDEEPTGDEVGDFETKEEDVSLTDGEEGGTISVVVEQPQDPVAMCEEFMHAIHVVPTEPDEIPINQIAAEETAIPTMKMVMLGMAQNLGKPVDPETVGPIMVKEALTELIPVCQWKYDEVSGDFTYNDGRTIDSEVGKEVLYGLMKLSGKLLDDFNKPEGVPVAGFDPVMAQG